MVDVLRQIVAAVGFCALVATISGALCWPLVRRHVDEPLRELGRRSPYGAVLAATARLLRPGAVVLGGCVVLLVVLQMIEPARP